MIIRKAKKSDLKKISEIFRIETAKKPYFQEWNKETALEKIKNSLKNDEAYVLADFSEVIGFITCKPDNKKKEVYIDELWLRADYQGSGLGRIFMNFIERHYKKKGMKRVTVLANQKAGAVKFYKKLNYKEKHRFIYFVKELK